MTMCLPSDGYTIDQSPYDVYARKQEWNHGLRCTGVIEAPNVVALETKASGFNVDGTELTLTKLNGLSVNDYALTSSLTAVSNRVTSLETKTSKLSYTSMMDLLTISSNVTLSKFMLINGTSGTDDSVSISCPNGKVVATNVTLTNKDDIDALKLKTSGFNADGTELTVTKLNGTNVTEYAMKGDLDVYATLNDLSTVINNVLTIDTRTSGFNADGSELTVTKLNGYGFYSGTSGSSNPATPWIAAVKTDGVMEVGRIIDFRHDMNVTNDYTCCVTCTASSMLNIPNITTNSIACSGNVTGANITTLTNKVTTLETKTTGISYSSGTTTIDSVPKIGSESLIDLIYPIGTVYQSSVASFNPNTKWGGTWVKIEGRFLFGSDTTRTVGSTGGAEKVTIGLNQIPDHSHMYEDTTHVCNEEKIYNSVMDTSRLYATSSLNSVSRSTSAIDREDPQSQLDIMPSFMVVNIWHRTA